MRAGNVPIVKDTLDVPVSVGVVNPIQPVPESVGVKSMPPIVPVKNVCPLVSVSVVSILLIADPDQF